MFGRAPVESCPVDVAYSLMRFWLCQSELETHGSYCATKCTTDFQVMAVNVQLQQVILNLIMNAIEPWMP